MTLKNSLEGDLISKIQVNNSFPSVEHLLGQTTSAGIADFQLVYRR